jgi:hypothetical protein
MLVNELYEPSQSPIPFWMDTLCVPRQYPERSLAIARMRDIYARADKVLVLDAVFSKISDKSSALDMAMSIRSSTWVRRLWTFHEAALAKDIYYQFSDFALQSWEINRLSGAEELNATIKFYIQKGWGPSMLDTSISTTMNEDDEPGRDLTLSLLERLMLLNPINDEGNTFTSKIEAKFEREPRQDFQLLKQATIPLRWRRTSRVEDEPICIGGVLAFDVEQLINLAPIERMKKLIGSLRDVPADILFIDKPRIQEEGYRWIPATFLGNGKHPGMSSSQAAKPSERGLLVKLPGFFLLDPFRVSQLVVPGFGEKLYGQINGTIQMIVPQEDPFQWRSYLNLEMAVVLNGPLKVASSTLGILVRVKEKRGGVIFCSLQCQVMVAGLSEEHKRTFASDIILTDLVSIPTSQEWCVG